MHEQNKSLVPLAPTGHRLWTVPTMEVNRATEAMTEDHRAALRWLQNYGFDQNKPIDEIATKLKKKDGRPYSRDSIYQALTGRRMGGLDPIVTSIMELRRTVEARTSVGFPFVTWPRSERIFELCEMAFTYQDIVFIYGRSHAGKTEPLKHYAATKPFGRAIYLEMPIGGYISAFKEDLAIKLRISPEYKTSKLSQLLRAAIDSGMILIIDQFHRAVPRNKRQTLGTLDFIMHLHDECGCGVVLCGTPQAKAEIENPQSTNAEFYKQVTNRSVGTFMIGEEVSVADLALFSTAIKLPRASGRALDLQTSVVRDHSLGKWIKLLRAGMRLAANKNQPLSWDHVVLSHSWLREQETAQ